MSNAPEGRLARSVSWQTLNVGFQVLFQLAFIKALALFLTHTHNTHQKLEDGWCNHAATAINQSINHFISHHKVEDSRRNHVPQPLGQLQIDACPQA